MWAAEEVGAFLAFAEKHKPRYAIADRLALKFGMRRGEIPHGRGEVTRASAFVRHLPRSGVAEADGNRTRQRYSAALTSFEDRGDHQAPRRLRVDFTDPRRALTHEPG